MALGFQCFYFIPRSFSSQREEREREKANYHNCNNSQVNLIVPWTIHKKKVDMLNFHLYTSLNIIILLNDTNGIL